MMKEEETTLWWESLTLRPSQLLDLGYSVFYLAAGFSFLVMIYLVRSKGCGVSWSMPLSKVLMMSDPD
ncbi:hypothetical protein V6N13_081169 [Hibiscus sabdariffa]|uniref:Uncharacterized protein n=1 Tax=Hibiscus sabdariffa TaxID=183260 RepID=A0ABR2DBS5_9ROSI